MNLSTLGGLFVFSVLLARTLGKETLGLYTLFTAVLMPFTLLVDLGQSSSLVQEVGRSPDSSNKLLKNTLFLKVVLTLLGTVLLVTVSIFIFRQPQDRKLFWIFGLILLPRTFYSTFEAMLRAHQQMIYPMMVAMITGVGLIAGSWFLLTAGFEFRYIVIFLIAIESLKAALIWLAYRFKHGFRLFKGDERVGLSFCWQLIRETIPFFALGVVGIFYWRIDIILLGWMQDKAEVGIFGAASNFVKVARLAPSVIVASFFPVISGMKKTSEGVKQISLKTLSLQLVASVVLAGVLFAIADWLIHQTYKFDESVPVLRVFVWSLIPLSLYSTIFYVFFQGDKSTWSMKILAGALTLNVLLNYFLIPELGAMALAVSAVVSESFCCLVAIGLFFYLVRNRSSKASGQETHEKLAALNFETT